MQGKKIVLNLVNKEFYDSSRIPKIYEEKLFSSCDKAVEMWAINHGVRPEASDYNIPQSVLINLPGDFIAKSRGRWGAVAVRNIANIDRYIANTAKFLINC